MKIPQDTLREMRDRLDDLSKDFDKAIITAYEAGFQAGVAITPNHTAFHKAHRDAQYYGEDGETVVVSGELTFTGACRKIYKLLKQDIDVTYQDVEEHTNSAKIAVGAAGQECDYYYDLHQEGVFGAWVWQA